MERGKLSLPHGESQDIGRLIPMEVSPIQSLDLEIIDKQKAELSFKKPQFGQYPLGRPSYFS
jgi:hypothetical protein